MKEAWEIKRLGQVSNMQNGFAFQSKDYSETGYFVIRIGNVQNGFIELNNPRYINLKDDKQKKFILNDGDILISLTGNVGRVGAINEIHLPAVLNQRVARISLNYEGLNKKYFCYFLSTDYFFKEIVKYGRGAAQQNISTTDIENIEIPIPSLLEQQRIVYILDEVLDAIAKARANAEQNLENAKELFERSIQEMLDKKNGEWNKQTLKSILASPPKNGWSPPEKNQTDTGIPVLTLSAVTGFVFKPNSVKYTNAIVKEDATYWIHNGDLLITRSNTPELVGHVAICKDLLNPTIYPDLMMKINPDESVVSTQFLYYQLKSPRLRQIIKDAAHGANPTMKKINKQDVEGFEIIYPSLFEQQKIVQKLDTLSTETKKLEGIYQNKLKELEELKKSVLQKAFSGDLKTIKMELI